jgi:hypothetical protein
MKDTVFFLSTVLFNPYESCGTFFDVPLVYGMYIHGMGFQQKSSTVGFLSKRLFTKPR